ncbi:hypothetical protein FEM08_26840 [Flavobacterium gilvum]|nr:hypothetical protein FEM08_26840 [Flavobacterium gilvum]
MLFLMFLELKTALENGATILYDIENVMCMISKVRKSF